MYNTPKSEDQIAAVIMALQKNGIGAVLATDRTDAKNKILEMIPKGSSVMTMTSVTLDELGISKAIQESGEYESVKTRLSHMDSDDPREKRAIGGAPEYALGSVHAVTEDGAVLVASATGSQLPAYAYGATRVIWAVGTQKIVSNVEEGMRRIREYTLPLESVRARKAYKIPGSEPGSVIHKLLTIYGEDVPGRMTIIFVPENIGF